MARKKKTSDYVVSGAPLTLYVPDHLGGVTMTFSAGETVPPFAYAHASAADQKRLAPDSAPEPDSSPEPEAPAPDAS